MHSTVTLPEELAQQGRALRRLATRLVGDPHDADDVVQDAFVRALQQPPREPGAAGAWMRRVVHGLSIDALRVRARRRRIEAPLSGPVRARDADTARGIELQVAVLEAIRALPEPYRETVWQRYFEGRAPRDIARAAGLPVKTVKTRLHRALGMLRGRLDAEHGGDRRAWALPLLATISPEPAGLAAGATPLLSSYVPSTLALWCLWMKSSAIRLTAAALVLLGGLAVGWSLLDPDDDTAPGRGPGAADPRAAAVRTNERSASPVADVETAETPAGAERRVLDGGPQVATDGALELRVLWHDREPAAGVGVALRREDPGRPRVVFASEVTGPDGRARFDGLEPGLVAVRTDRESDLRGESVEVEVTAGATVERELVLGRGVDVDGVVVGADGEPVGGARVWLQSLHTDWAGGRVAALAGSDGRFALRAAPPGASLGALAAPGGHEAPSELVDLDLLDPADGVVQVRLVLGMTGGRLIGRVVALDDGRPLAGARVAVGVRPRQIDRRGDRVIEQWSPRAVRADEGGRFAFDGLQAGEHEYAVRHEGYGISRGEVAIVAERDAELAVALPRAATVYGQVRDEGGGGLPNVSVFAYDSEPGMSFIQGGQIDFDRTFGHVGTVTADDGRFRLAGVTPGTAHLLVQALRKERPTDRESSSGQAYVHEERTIEAGAEVEWNPILTDGRVIEGWALYRDGRPLDGEFVTLRAPDGTAKATIVTDRDGHFRFVCLTGPLYSIYVQVFDQPRGTPPVELHGVVPDRGPVEVRATFDRPAEAKPARVTGRVLDDGRRLTNRRAATVLLVTESNSWHTSQIDADGLFDFRHVEPGTLRLVVMDCETAVHHGEPFEVAAAELRDVGTVTTRGETAAMRVTLRRGDATEGMEPAFYLRRADGRRGATARPGRASSFEVGNLDPGDYAWSMYCSGAVSQTGTVTLRVGAPASVDVELIAGATCRFDVRYAAEADLGDVTIVYEREGTEFARRTYQPGSALDFRRYTVAQTLPPGDWRAVMTTTKGLRAEARFTIRSVDDRPEPVLELR
jgi:RNA polymerase sigma-70 factor (ECF subfamily)